MVAEFSPTDAPANPVHNRRADALEYPGTDVGGALSFRPGLNEQVPGTEVRNGTPLKREEALFAGGFSFDQIDPPASFRDEKTEGKIWENRDRNGVVRIRTVEKDNQLETTERNFDGSVRRSVKDLTTGEDKITSNDRNGRLINDRSEERLVRDLTTELNAAAQAQRFSGAVAIAKIGERGTEVLYQRALGDANRETGEKNDINTRFRLASMGKMFTGVAIMQLAESGALGKDGIDSKLSDVLSGDLGEYFKKNPKPDGKEITVRDVLEHKAGMGDIFGKTFDAHKDDQDFRSIDGQINRFIKDGKPMGEPPESEPDANGNTEAKLPKAGEFAYSNFGYLLLGKIVEERARTPDGQKYKDYADYVDKNIFQRAGMTRSGYEPEDKRLEGRATNYMDDGSFNLKPADATLPQSGGPAGGGYSTVPDLLKFGQALANGSLFNNPETGKQLLTNGGRIHDFANYGPGRYDETKDGVRSIYHHGGSQGMNTSFRYYPDTGHISVVLTNMDPPTAEHIDNYIHDRIPRKK